MNSFTFKQFVINQDQCAMKVGTDGVLLGSWCPIENAQNILDIGTGTGLLALMMAQRQPTAQIDAIEIDSNAAQQAKDNIAASPWKNRIKVIKQSLQQFANTTDNLYDLIICNPPYFINSLTPPNELRTLARHCGTLTHSELAKYANNLLAQNGHFVVIMPIEEGSSFLQIAKKSNLFCNHQLMIHPTPQSAAKRQIMVFSQIQKNQSIEHLTIEIARHQYTNEYRQLTKEFYLKF